ncbi:MAG: hypothetical protein OEY20_10985 [Gemmatimonadota bacterium]|nr:hypothetical protein [Gemmatimonadota bacterium]MDH4351339.1 hypothetical protein [Gemmatimonadota bacterium]MDH5197767.1 hypothetical protein [Gemmatimonadota bacterium]
MLQKVVAHFIDHSVVKGTSADVDPKRPLCHVHTPERAVVEVDLRQVKALFFVKDFGGQPDYDEQLAASAGDQRLRGSRQVELTFSDGERLGGLMNRYPPLGVFFYMLPIDPKSNNVRILVNREAVATMRAVDEKQDAPAPRATGPQRIGLSEPPVRPKRTSWVFDGSDIKQFPTD